MRRFYLLHLGGALALAAMALLLIEWLNLDWQISDWFFDPALQRFPLQESGFLEKIFHVGFKYAVVVLALSVLAGWLASFVVARFARYRRVLLFLLLAMLLAPAVVSGLKSATGKHCPYELEAYGGTVPFTGLLERPPVGVKPGKCWPGGHASAGFCLFAFYFAAGWFGRCGLARAALAGALLLGFGVGMVRVAQGAHFVSHNVWSALICWLVALSLYEALLRRGHPAEGD